MSPRFVITADPLDAAALAAAVVAEGDGPEGRGRNGALATFVGLVRSPNAGRRVLRLEYEAYDTMALGAFRRIDAEARAAWPDVTLGIHHRTGTLLPGEASVVIAAVSPHRAHAFAACRYAIERIKQIAPIWKREYFEGGDTWVDGAIAHPDDEEPRKEAMRRACA